MKYSMKSYCRTKRLASAYGAGGLLLLISVLLGIFWGATNLTAAELWEALRTGATQSPAFRILIYVRLPRVWGAVICGSALAVSGAVIQGVLRNHLASPGIIGVNAGAGLAVTIACAFGAISGWTVAGAAFLGAFAAAFLVLFAAKKAGASRTTVVLGGVAVNSILNALSEAVTILVPDIAMLSREFRIGTFTAVVHTRLLPAGVLILAGLVVLLTLCSELDVLALGEDTAQSLGLPVKRFRMLFLLLAALLAGAAVSFAGLLGFVGLIVPHAARKLGGSQCRRLLPLCALSGAGFVTVCDVISRLLFRPYDLPAGILLSLLGGPFFLMLLWKRKGGRSHG